MVVKAAVEGRAGGALLPYGFRPFFLSAALWAVASIVAWTGVMAGAFAVFVIVYGPRLMRPRVDAPGGG